MFAGFPSTSTRSMYEEVAFIVIHRGTIYKNFTPDHVLLFATQCNLYCTSLLAMPMRLLVLVHSVKVGNFFFFEKLQMLLVCCLYSLRDSIKQENQEKNKRILWSCISLFPLFVNLFMSFFFWLMVLYEVSPLPILVAAVVVSNYYYEA